MTPYRKRRALVAICAMAWCAAFVATHIPLPELPEVPGSDKTLHVAGYFALSVLFGLTLVAHNVAPVRCAVLILGVMAIYGAVDELTQPLVNRHASWEDWLADMVGAAAAVVTLSLVRRLSPPSPPH